jgi:serine/threonine protein kinase
MELSEGSLEDLLDVHFQEYAGPLAADYVCFLLAQVAEALDFLNTQKHVIDGRTVTVQHCDVKPTNMLLFNEKVKLCDFGLATLMTFPTMNHRRAGTPAYAAPEVFLGRLSNRTDQFALAVSYCQLRSGRFPFKDTPKDLTTTYVHPAPDLSMLNARERPIIARALAVNPQARWNSSSEMIDKLANLLI